MDHGKRVAAEVHVEPRERAPRSADEIERQPRPLPRPARAIERTRDLALQHARPLVADRADAQYAERERHALADLAATNADEFEAAAAEIADNAIGLRDRRQHAVAGARCFLLAAEQFDLEP